MYLYINIVQTITFERPMYPVPENNETVEVCLRSSTGNTDPIEVEVIASQKPDGNFAEGRS